MTATYRGLGAGADSEFEAAAGIETDARTLAAQDPRPGQGHRNLRAPPFHHLPLSSASGPALRPEPARFSPTGSGNTDGAWPYGLVSGEMSAGERNVSLAPAPRSCRTIRSTVPPVCWPTARCHRRRRRRAHPRRTWLPRTPDGPRSRSSRPSGALIRKSEHKTLGTIIIPVFIPPAMPTPRLLSATQLSVPGLGRPQGAAGPRRRAG